MEIVYDFKQLIWGIAVDVEDNIFVANHGNKSIDKISLNNGKVSVTQRTKTSSSPYGLAINSKNEIYIGTSNAEIKKMTKEGNISNIAGNGTFGFADGIGKDAKIGFVHGICFDENDIAYFCDYNYLTDSYHLIRKLTPEGKVTTICGGERGNSDGKGEQAKFYRPRGIVYNNSTKLFYITDSYNKSIRTMTVDGNVNTLCKYSDYLQAIAIDGEGKLYVSTVKDISSEEGELFTVDSKGEIKQMNISVKGCRGMAFNSKGDLFFTSDRKLKVIRNCTKYPPHPIFSPLTNLNTKELQHENQELRNLLASTQAQLTELESKAQRSEIKSKEMETEIQHLREWVWRSEVEKKPLREQAQDLEIRLEGKEVQIEKLSNEKEELKEEIEKLKEQIRSKKPNNETKGWLSSFILANKNINL